ncbi:MAG TPA: VWA domain-containing protein [Thermoanaerobaculia bacterium]
MTALVFLASGLAFAQAAPPPPGGPAPAPAQQAIPPVVESVQVSITSIDVVVTDSKGNRVTGLTADDFEIRQDGVPQKVTNFYAVSGGKVLLEDGKVVDLESPAAIAELPQELKTRYLFYIDNLNIQPINRNRMFRRLKEFIRETVGPNAEGMVVTYNRSLKVKKRFTSDPNEIINAIDETEKETGGGTTLASERRDTIQRINDAQSAAEGEQIARSYARALRNDLEFTVDAIKSTITGLAGVDGRKVFVYVSEGLPAIAGQELYDTVQQKFREGSNSLEQFEFDMNMRYLGIVQAANAQGVTIWALDASGLASDEFISAENRTMDTRPSAFFMRQNTQAPLNMMAEQTGGMAATNTNDWKGSLDELSKDFSNFYSLGFRSPQAANDKPHRVEVSVKKKGMTVRARKGYVEKTIETRTAETVLASLFYPRNENPLGIKVATGDSKPHDDETFLLPVRISIPIGRLGLVPAGDNYEGTVFFYFVVLDVTGKQSDLQIQKQAVRVPSKDFEMAQKKDYVYDVSLIVVPGGQKVAVAVRDGVSSQTSYVQKNVFVSILPKEQKAGK